MVRDEDDRLLPHPIRFPRPTKGEKNPHTQAERKALQTTGAKFPCRGILPCVKTTSIYGRKCFFRHVEAEEKPSKKSKKDGAKGSVALLKESTKVGCVSQDSCTRRSIQREEGKLGSKHAVNFSKGTWHQKKKKIGKERVHREE